MTMQSKRVALITGANQGVGLQVAKELVANGLTVLVGSRNFERGEAAAKEIGPGAVALQIDATALAQAIVDTVVEPLVVLDSELRVVTASRSFYLTFQVNRQN